MMKMKTALQADHQLDQLAGQFGHWRQTRSHPAERIPTRRWKQAAALARVLPYSRVAQHVRLSPSALKKHMAPPHDSKLVTSPRFVEEPPTSVCLSETRLMEIALERPDGARLRLRCSESTSAVTAVIRAFWEGAR